MATVSLPVAGGAVQPHAANMTDHLQIYTAGAICPLTSGSSGWTPYAFLMADANGCGTPLSGAGIVGALALTAVAAGGIGPVVVLEPSPQVTESLVANLSSDLASKASISVGSGTSATSGAGRSTTPTSRDSPACCAT